MKDGAEGSQPSDEMERAVKSGFIGVPTSQVEEHLDDQVLRAARRVQSRTSPLEEGGEEKSLRLKEGLSSPDAGGKNTFEELGSSSSSESDSSSGDESAHQEDLAMTLPLYTSVLMVAVRRRARGRRGRRKEKEEEVKTCSTRA